MLRLGKISPYRMCYPALSYELRVKASLNVPMKYNKSPGAQGPNQLKQTLWSDLGGQKVSFQFRTAVFSDQEADNSIVLRDLLRLLCIDALGAQWF